MVHHHPCKRSNKRLDMLGISEHLFPNAIDSEKVSYWNGLYVLIVLGLSVTYLFLIILVPLHNHFDCSIHWYELVMDAIRNSLVIVFLLVPIVILDCYHYFKIGSMVSIICFLRLSTPVTMVHVTIHVMLSLIWNIGLGYNLPVPFNGFLVCLTSGVFILSLWSEFPYRLRKNPVYRRRFRFYIFGFVLLLLAIFQYDFLSIMIPMLPPYMHWILAILLPMLRDINKGIFDKCLDQSMPYNRPVVKLGFLTFIRSLNTIYVAIILANVNERTLYSITGIEFVLQFHSCYKIIKLQRKIMADNFQSDEMTEKVKANVTDLVLGETIDVLASLAYSITLAVAYHGPNATILGNIKNSFWTYEEIWDIYKSLELVFWIALIDFGIAVFCGILLWIFCRINLFREFCRMMKTNWLSIALRISFIMSRVGLDVVYYLNVIITY